MKFILLILSVACLITSSVFLSNLMLIPCEITATTHAVKMATCTVVWFNIAVATFWYWLRLKHIK